MKKLFLSLIVFALLACLGFQMNAQNVIFPDGTEYSYESIATTDGNILTISQPTVWPFRLHLTKMETDGDILWNKDYDSEIYNTPYRVFNLPDGNLAVFSTLGIIKLTSEGEFIFETNLDPSEFGYEPIPGEIDIITTKIIQLEDGFEVLSTGYAGAPTNSGFHVITKLNYSGVPVWSYSYILDDFEVSNINNHEGKTYVLLTDYTSENRVEIIDDMTGNIISTTVLPEFSPKNMKDIGTGILIAGIKDIMSDRLIKISYEGDTIWTKEYPFPDADSINGIIQINQLTSGVLVGLVAQGDYPDTRYILRYYSAEGNVISEVDDFADYDPMFFYDFKIQNDQMIFTGVYNSWPIYNGLVVLTDSAGNFFKTYIAGKVYKDENENDIVDIGEHPFKNVVVKVGIVPFYGVTNDSGEYAIPVYEPGTYNVVIENPVHWDLNEPSSYNLDIDAGMDGDTLSDNDFRLDYTTPITDLRIIVYDNNVVPGTATNMIAYIYNYGNQFDITGTGFLHHPSELTYVSGTPYDSYIDTTFIWTTSALDPGDSYLFDMNFIVDEDLDLGEILTTEANVEPVAGDFNPTDNYSIEYEYVVESLDPNHKTAEPEGVGINGSTDPETEWIEYTIQFQNLGTSPAIFINIIDTIDNDFEFNSIEMIAATHQYEMELIAPNVIQWHFENINLPDSASDPLGSIGHIIFRLKLNEDAGIGTQITNTAAIYFDYNLPVITNTTLNTLEELPQVDVEEELINNLFSIYPNPVSDELTIQLNSDASNFSLDIFDMQGRIVYPDKASYDGTLMYISTTTLSTGIYLIQLTNGKTGISASVKFVKE